MSIEIERAFMMSLWNNRFENPEFVLRISDADTDQFQKSIDYLSVKPKLAITRNGGKGLTVVQMVDQDGNQFKPIESTTDGAEKRDIYNEKHRQKDKARMLCDELRSFLATGDFAESTIRDTIKALEVLAQ